MKSFSPKAGNLKRTLLSWILIASSLTTASLPVSHGGLPHGLNDLLSGLRSMVVVDAISPRLVRLLESEAGRYLVFDTDSGRQVLRRSLGEHSLAEANRDLTPLIEKLSQPAMKGVAERLEATLLRISGKTTARFGAAGEEIFKSSSRRALTASESAELRSLSARELKIDITFYPSELFAKDYDYTRQFWVRASCVSQRAWIRWPTPTRTCNSDLRANTPWIRRAGSLRPMPLRPNSESRPTAGRACVRKSG
jgi:hypothetical protein